MITQLPIWQKLIKHHKTISSKKIINLFKNNNLLDFTFKIEDLYFDLSKNIISIQTIELLINLAVCRKLRNNIDDLFHGKQVNFTEGKQALHMAYRAPNTNIKFIANPQILSAAIKERKKMHLFVNHVRRGTITGCTGKVFTDIVNIGVGGSILGPQMISHALSEYHSLFKLHFVSSMDGEEIVTLLKKLNPETTLFIIVSKSFKTIDTIANAKTAKDWLKSYLTNIQPHIIGVSENKQLVIDFEIDEKHFFKIEEYVGGRYSVWSPASLGIALAIGEKYFNDFLLGAHLVDQHFMFSSFSSNIPVLLGLIDIWYVNFFNWQNHLILPYSSSLKFFPSYLQQLEMESCGKQVTKCKENVTYATGPFVWGDVGFLGQHSFYQLLHQGTQKFFTDLIIPIQLPAHTDKHHRNIVLSNALAQIQALIEGNSNSDMFKKNYGNKPLNIILFPKITPKILGMLIAIYEHKVFTKGTIWDINPFDQHGVEWGKQLATNYMKKFQHKKQLISHSNSPIFMNNILDYILNKN